MGFNNHAQRSTPPNYLDVDNPFKGYSSKKSVNIQIKFITILLSSFQNIVVGTRFERNHSPNVLDTLGIDTLIIYSYTITEFLLSEPEGSYL